MRRRIVTKNKPSKRMRRVASLTLVLAALGAFAACDGTKSGGGATIGANANKPWGRTAGNNGANAQKGKIVVKIGGVCPDDGDTDCGDTTCCPGDFPFCCSDGATCADDEGSCDLPVCPDDAPVDCGDGTCCAEVCCPDGLTCDTCTGDDGSGGGSGYGGSSGYGGGSSTTSSGSGCTECGSDCCDGSCCVDDNGDSYCC